MEPGNDCGNGNSYKGRDKVDKIIYNTINTVVFVNFLCYLLRVPTGCCIESSIDIINIIFNVAEIL